MGNQSSASRQAQGTQRDSGCPERELEASTSSSSSAATLRPDYKPRGSKKIFEKAEVHEMGEMHSS